MPPMKRPNLEGSPRLRPAATEASERCAPAGARVLRSVEASAFNIFGAICEDDVRHE